MNPYLRIGSLDEAAIRCPEVNGRPVDLHIQYTRGDYLLAHASQDFTPVKINGRSVELPYQLAARDAIQIGSHTIYWANYREVGERQELYISDLTTWRGRLSRSNFRALFALFIGMCICLYFTPSFFVNAKNSTTEEVIATHQTIAPWIWGVGYTLLFLLLLLFAVKRIRDTGHSAWKLLIPGYNLKLLFMEPGKVYGGKRLADSPN